MSKKLIAILCAVLMPVSLAFAGLASDVAGDSPDLASALTNEVMAVMANDTTLTADQAKDIATQNLVTALLVANYSPSEAAAAATGAGASESVAYSAAGATAPGGQQGGDQQGGDQQVGNQQGGNQQGGNQQGGNGTDGGEPGSGQEDKIEDNSYGKPA
jgi:hypothetical protein